MNSAIDRSSGVREMVIADGKNHLAAVRELIGEMVLDTILPLKAAISLYKKNGFHECEAYYRNPMSDVIYMRKELYRNTTCLKTLTRQTFLCLATIRSPATGGVEVGMGKGRFLMDMAKLHPEVNYIGIEMYDSVLLRAIQKREALAEEGQNLPNLMFMRMDAR